MASSRRFPTPPDMLPLHTPVFCVYNKIRHAALWIGGTTKVLLDDMAEKRSPSGWITSLAARSGKMGRTFDGWNKCFIKTADGGRQSLFQVREAALATPGTVVLEDPEDDDNKTVLDEEVYEPSDPKIAEISIMLVQMTAQMADLNARLADLMAPPEPVAEAKPVAEPVAEPKAEAKPVAEPKPKAVHPYAEVLQLHETSPVEDLVDAYTFNTGLKSAYCKHCHKEQPLSCFSLTLKKQAKKGAIGKQPLKTCDIMMELNARANPHNNAVGNAKTGIKTWTKKMYEATTEEGKVLANQKIAQFTTKLAEALTKRATWDAEH